MTHPIASSVLDIVGQTPVVRLGRLNSTEVEILCKLDFLNPGGSTKDRPLSQLVLEAEKTGELGPGSTIVDSSSGNFAVAMALAGAARGYRVICIVDPKLTEGIEQMLRALGAELVFATRKTSTGSYLKHRLEIRKELVETIDGAWCPDQYRNPGISGAHYDSTGKEIVDTMKAYGGRFDALVIATGTGGTITGSARRVKENFPDTKIVACDAYGSQIFDRSVSPWLQKGLGSGLRAEDLGNLDASVVDEVRLVEDCDAFLTARALVCNEGMMAGGSSGSVIFASLTLAKTLPPGARIVTILADRMERYFDEHVGDTWMTEKGFDTASSGAAVEARVDHWLATSESVDSTPPVLRPRPDA
ncbi:MAG: cysteine synthase family protein [Acidobacteriota bacterium]